MLECRDIESLMMDWLYDELDQSNTAEFQEHLSSCSSCEEELRSLEATREAFSALPSEEPPASVSAILLHEAAKNAPVKVAAREPLEERSGGFWAWLVGLFAPIAAHPAAAAVASLVLVAGVAGTLYVTKGSDHIAQPELARTPSEPERVVTLQPGATTTSGDTAIATGEADGRGAPAPDLADLEVPAQEEQAAAEPAEPKPAAAAPTTTAKAGRSYEADLLPADDQGKLRERVAEDRRRQAERDSKRASIVSEKKKSVASAGKRSKKKRNDFRSPETTNAVSGADPLNILDEAGEADDNELSAGAKSQRQGIAFEKSKNKDKDSTYRVYKQRELQWATTQRKALTQAVKKEDCRRAARIANDILDRNVEYYTKSVKNSKDVKKCSWYVKDERQRRVKSRRARAKRGAKKKRKSAGEPTKAKAAPREEEAADAAFE